MRLAEVVFTGAGVWGIAVLTPLYWLVDVTGRQYSPPADHPQFFYGFLSVAMAWQLAFFVIGSSPARFRPLIDPERAREARPRRDGGGALRPGADLGDGCAGCCAGSAARHPLSRRVCEDMNTPTASGLDGIVVADTTLSHVDGEHGRLIVRGYSVETLVERATFEEACALLWNGVWPSTHERNEVRAALAEARAEAFAMLPSLGGALVTPDGMEVLRAAVGHLRTGNSAGDRVRLTGALPARGPWFSPMFAASRVVGWCAHIDEQRAVGRLIRPASVYVRPLGLEQTRS